MISRIGSKLIISGNKVVYKLDLNEFYGCYKKDLKISMFKKKFKYILVFKYINYKKDNYLLELEDEIFRDKIFDEVVKYFESVYS